MADAAPSNTEHSHASSYTAAMTSQTLTHSIHWSISSVNVAGGVRSITQTAPTLGLPMAQPNPSEPRVPEMVNLAFFYNVQQVDTFLAIQAWKPSSGNHGFPVTHGDFLRCVKKIHHCIITVDKVFDKETHPADLGKFLPGGECSNSKDLEAVSVRICYVIRDVHEHGTRQPPLRLPGAFRDPAVQDMVLTFYQRLHWTCFLLRHFKAYANRFMCQIAVEAHVARIWSVLSMESAFRGRWLRLDTQQKHNHMYVAPYMKMTSGDLPVTHPERAAPQSSAGAVQASMATDSGSTPSGPSAVPQSLPAHAADNGTIGAGPLRRPEGRAPAPPQQQTRTEMNQQEHGWTPMQGLEQIHDTPLETEELDEGLLDRFLGEMDDVDGSQS
jgi:hypothetical protein